ncbi:MAG TPA: 50S ribosomal protein L23 [Patescibacteria group bacterium]|nr:50S ribosomal protein L23 [Patescibacteria group bacterium]
MKFDKLIIHPLVTEKSAIAESKGKYFFKVEKNSNKIEVKKAVEKIFGVKVADVNIINTRSKTKRRGRIFGTVGGFKKALVTLKKGQSIKLREEKKEEKKAKTKVKEEKAETKE